MSLARARSIATTAILWVYFIGAFLAGYWLVFVLAGLVRGRRGLAWGLASYARGFLAAIGFAIPRLRIDVPERLDLRATRGTMVVCNHISFLDPVLLVSLLPATITIVRPDFFRMPIFGWLMRGAGFLGPDLFSEGQPWIERVARHLRAGGNLLIFPEGTRSRDGQLAPFKKGAFYLARLLAAPVLVLRVRGTNHLFAPGRMVLDTAASEPIELRRLAAISATDAAAETTDELAQRVRELYEGE